MKNLYLIQDDICIVYYQKPNGQLLKIVIDKEDLAFISDFAVNATREVVKRRDAFYAVLTRKKNKKKKRFYLHRLIMGCQENDGIYVDHIDSDGLNNRRKNLRKTTNAENLQNRRSVPSNNTSGIINVTYCKFTGKWAVGLTFNGKKIWGGRHKDKEKAREAAIKLRKKYLPFSKEARMVE
jgi:hypothetical protein